MVNAIVERYAYDPYGRPLIRESLGRGDTRVDTIFLSQDDGYMVDAEAATIWDPRCDIDDDGDVDADDLTAYAAKKTVWPNPSWHQPTVSQAYSDVGNPYMFQGVPNFAIDTETSATVGKYMLNHHRARFADPVIGRWLTRDPLFYSQSQGLQPNLHFGLTFPSPKKLISRFVGRSLELSKFNRLQTTMYELGDSALTTRFDPTGLCTFQNCSPVQVELARSACDGVEDSVNELLDDIQSAIDNDEGQYPAFTGIKLAVAKRMLKCIQSKKDNLIIDCTGCGCGNPPPIAWTMPFGNTVVVCAPFYQSYLQKRIGTVVHELAHKCWANDAAYFWDGPPSDQGFIGWEWIADTYSWWIENGFCIPGYSGLYGCGD